MGTTGAAIIAVLLLSYAFVQSTVMQAAVAAAVPAIPVCGMGSVTGAPADAGKAPAHAPNQSTCPFCAAASHPPLVGALIIAPIPVAIVFVAFIPLESHGPRGPPPLPPRARGPPITPVTA
ncbi:MAG TPA: DUF2946 family protein [Caulobacteraceae bacterium]